MTPQRFAEVRALYEAVAELPADQRHGRLHDLSRDALLIAEVGALFHAGAIAPSGWITRPLNAAMASIDPPDPAPGDIIGVWKIGAEIGHGGMGKVFRAQRHDGHFEQAAAIKLLRGTPSSEALERFAHERQLLATLAHPHIARLLDGGATATGQPYLVMELIEGDAIDAYVRKRRLTQPEILRLLIAICDSVGFAHQRLVVHCDLKPANILVDAAGRPVLLDFGIARLLDGRTPDSDRLAAGSLRAFTPGYASPEQRDGRAVSTATDVYGLGCVMWTLLAGKARDTGSEDTATVPSAVQMPAALRAIVTLATSDDPAHRYPSAGAMADDLRRYLQQQPVRAMGQRRWYRLGCALRRHALVLGLAGFAALALVGGLWSSLVSLAAAHTAGARAERTADFLGHLLSAIDPDQARNLDTRLLRTILDEAARAARTELADEPLVLADISAVIGQTYHQISEYDQARVQFRQALELLPLGQVRERLVLREQLANAEGALGASKEALASYEAVHAERLRAFGADDPDTLRSAYTLVYQRIKNGEFRTALAAGSALQPRLERLLGETDQTTLDNLQMLAAARTELGDFAAAEATLKQLQRRRLQIPTPMDTRAVAVHTSLAILYLRQQRFADAETLLRPLVPQAQQHFGKQSFAAINLASLLGSALRLGGKLEESEPFYRLAFESARELWGSDNIRTLGYEINVANFEVASGAAASALARLERIAPKLIALVGDSPDVAELHRTRARAHTALKQAKAARRAWRQALAIDRKVFGDDRHPQVLEDLAGIVASDS